MYVRGNYSESRKTEIRQHFSNVVRVAYLLCRKELFVPLSNYLESILAFDVLNNFSSIPMGLNPLVFLSTAPKLENALKKKEREHQEHFLGNPNFRYKDFSESGLLLPGAFRTRTRSASMDIENDLMDSIANDQIWRPFQNFIIPSLSFERFQYQLSALPSLLSGQAYISDYVLPHLSINTQMKENADRQMNISITRWYLKSFLTELDAVCLKDIQLVNASEILPTINGKEHISYSAYANKLRKKIKKRSIFKTKQTTFEYISRCSIDALVEFKYSNEWESIYSPQEQSHKLFSLGGATVPCADIRIGVVAALPEEAAAIEVLLDNPRVANFDSGRLAAGNIYKVGTIKSSDGGRHKIATCLLPDMGNNFASAVAMKMQMLFPTIEHIIVCGIAGGIPQEVCLGDVVVSTNGVIQYDYGKNIIDGDGKRDFIEKDSGTPCSLFLSEATTFLKKEALIHGNKWTSNIARIDAATNADFSIPNWTHEEYFQISENGEYRKVKRKISKAPSMHCGKIASGNVVQKSPETRDALYAKHKIIAVEMEAAGIKDSTRLQNNGYIAIRGICDYCDGTKGDEWHNYAAAVAAAYTYALIESIPTT